MAIRIGPPPALARLRLHWHATQNYYLRQARTVRETATDTTRGVTLWWRNTSTKLSMRLRRHARAQARQQAQYAAFFTYYEDLVDLLCWAAKDGVHTERDARYAELRRWMQLNYHRIRPHLRAHLDTWEGPFDPFEELFAPECIDEIINDPACIQFMMQTRMALDAYSATLENAPTRPR
jgi:hypothetical protein